MYDQPFYKDCTCTNHCCTGLPGHVLCEPVPEPVVPPGVHHPVPFHGQAGALQAGQDQVGKGFKALGDMNTFNHLCKNKILAYRMLALFEKVVIYPIHTMFVLKLIFTHSCLTYFHIFCPYANISTFLNENDSEKKE